MPAAAPAACRRGALGRWRACRAACHHLLWNHNQPPTSCASGCAQPPAADPNAGFASAPER